MPASPFPLICLEYHSLSSCLDTMQPLKKSFCLLMLSFPLAETLAIRARQDLDPSAASTAATAASFSAANLPPATADPSESTAAVMSCPIQKGYTAVGDSYAVGFGTGATEVDGCRRGENSYPRQLAAMAEGTIDFQNLACSGAVAGEVLQGGDESQIDAWTNPSNAGLQL